MEQKLKIYETNGNSSSDNKDGMLNVADKEVNAKKSLMGYNWVFNKENSDLASQISSSFGIDISIANILSNKNFATIEDIELFLNPKIKYFFQDPFSLLDMRFAVDRIKTAVLNNEKITVFGDYDVDGGCSSAMLKKFFKSIGVDAQIYIPDRFTEGYGPNSVAFEKLKASGVSLVITVDCGTVSFEPLEKAYNIGLDTIVIDHHLGVKEKPKSIAVVNPNRFDEITDLTYLCGAGVTFLLISAINKDFRDSGFYLKNNIKEPNIIELTDLLAMATVCDVVPLVCLNRAFVKTGLEVLNKTKNQGVKALIEVCGISKSKITEFHLGFMLGPRINAGSRVGSSSLGARLLSCDNYDEAITIATELNRLNGERKEIERSVLVKIEEEELKSGDFDSEEFVFVGSKNFHQGVIGIVASRMKERYNKPAIVMEYKDGIAKSSCRSIKGVHIGNAINLACKEGLVIKGGGHEMAGGFSAKIEDLERLKQFFCSVLNDKIIQVRSLGISLNIDSFMSLDGVSASNYELVEAIGPFGEANPKPIFATTSVILSKIVPIGDKTHLSLIFKCELSGSYLRCVVFNVYERFKNHQMLKDLVGKKVDIVYTMKLNEYMGSKTVEIDLIDIRQS